MPSMHPKMRHTLCIQLLQARKHIVKLEQDALRFRQLEAVCREAKQYLQALVDSLPSNIAIVDAEGIIQTVNESWRQFARDNPPVRTNVCTGANYLQVCDQAQGPDAHIAQSVGQAIRDVLKGRQHFYIQEYPCHSPEQKRWFVVRVYPFPSDGPRRALVVHENITELKQTKEELEHFFLNTQDLLCIMTPQGRFLQCNPAFSHLLGHNIQELTHAALLDFIHPEDRQTTYRELLAPLPGDGLTQCESRFQRRDGTYEWLSWNANYFRDENKIYASGRIITGRKKAEAAKEQLEEQLRQSQKMEAIGILAGGIAHDFNNLLQVINGRTKLALADTPPGSAGHAHLQEVVKAGERASGLVSQLLALGRQQTITLETLNMNSVIRDMSRMLEGVIGENLRINLQLQPDLKPVRADLGMMEQVLMNLCLNARDAMPGGGLLTIETLNVSFDSPFLAHSAQGQPGDYIQINVRDTGQGMDGETLSRMFEPFFTTKDKNQGSGFGLSTVYGIIKQHQGFIQVISEPGHGTTFYIFLPVGVQKTATPEKTGPQPEGGRHGQETILLAEDNAMVRDLTQEMLEQAGYKVITASDGQEAVTIFEQYQASIDLVVLDMVMPCLGGYEAYLRMYEYVPGMPVLFVSGYTDSADVTTQILKNKHPLIKKPFDRDQFLQTIRDLLHVRDKSS